MRDNHPPPDGYQDWFDRYMAAAQEWVRLIGDGHLAAARVALARVRKLQNEKVRRWGGSLLDFPINRQYGVQTTIEGCE